MSGVKTEITLYLHSSKETNWNAAEDAGLSEEGICYFKYALLEVEFKLEVDKQTGEYQILTVDGRKLEETK